MKKCLLIAVLLLGGQSLAHAASFTLFASIDGAQAGTGSAATGSGLMTYDDVSGQLTWNIIWSGLEGTITAAHFHGPAVPGMGAGVQVPINPLTSPSNGSASIDAGQAADLLAGLWYINIHSTQSPGGEIRGQVQVIPVPAAAWLFLSGLGALGFWRRRG